MNIMEMVIEVRQGSQNIASNTRRRLLDAEIVWMLNKNQERFIQSKIKPKKDGTGGFQVDQLDADAIRPILQAGTEIPVFNIDTVESMYEAQLPGDYMYLISDDSKVVNLCGSATTPPTSSTQQVAVIPLPDSTLSTAPFYAAASITVGGTTTSLSSLIAFYNVSDYTGLKSNKEKFILKDLLLHHMRNVLNLEVYWERYKDIYKHSSFIFPENDSGSITVDGTTVAGDSTTINIVKSPLTAGKWVPNRLTASDKISTILVTPFLAPSVLTPVSELSKQSLQVYANPSFIITGVRIDYIRRPRRMNLSLNQDCELPEDFHQAICDLTVEYFKALTADPNWEVKLKDNMTRSVVTT